jgi:hypothetical protein
MPYSEASERSWTRHMNQSSCPHKGQRPPDVALACIFLLPSTTGAFAAERGARPPPSGRI